MHGTVAKDGVVAGPVSFALNDGLVDLCRFASVETVHVAMPNMSSIARSIGVFTFDEFLIDRALF